jgi:cellulose synthase/poly-beta-1,6-N-acetylglucosamine synthase-like glycosyltransferase
LTGGRHGGSDLWSGQLGLERARVAVRVFSDAGSVKTSALLAEAAALCVVVHPCVVKVLATAIDEQQGSCLLLVSEWTENSLNDALDSLGMPARVMALLQAALGLAALHEHPAGPFVAGDVRASTIAIGVGGVARIADWGMTRVVRAVERAGGADGSRALWRAPELFSRRGGGSTLSVSSDVYSFAITMYEVLSGLEPYSDVDAAPAEIISRVVAGGAHPLRPSLSTLPPNVPANLVSTIESAWAQDTIARPTMRKIISELKAACVALGVGPRAEAAMRDDASARSSVAPLSSGPRFRSSGTKTSSALTLYVDDEDLPTTSAAAATAFTAAAVPAQREPRVVLSPYWKADPPIWEPTFDENAGYTPIPTELDKTLLPLPPRAAAACIAAVVVPFYTEGGFALRRTLEALALQVADLRTVNADSGETPPELHVFAIADGWTKANDDPIFSQSAFTEILDIFGPTLDVDALIDMMEGPADKPERGDGENLPSHVFIQFAAPTGRNGNLELKPVVLDCSWALGMNARAKAPEGAIVRQLRQRRRRKTVSDKRRLRFKRESSPLLGSDEASVHVGGDDDTGLHGDMQPLYFTLMIKRRNGKKHHSLRWFFEALGPVTRMRGSPRFEYMFATDCGTLYAPYCIAELITHLKSNDNCAAVTAHQRIMDKHDQMDPLGAEPDTFVSNWLRCVQGYDFESGLCVFNGMHGLAGFLPVVPGPCGLFRASAITNNILARVRGICHSTPEDGLVLSNLLLAEDRILSYLLVLVATPVKGELFPRTWQTHWVPSSVFFFESESTLKELVLQRRRWLNGTSAGYVWLLGQAPLWRGVCAFRGTAWAVLLLSIMQLMVFGIVFVWPGMLILTGTLAISGLGVLLGLCGLSTSYWSAFEITYIAATVGSFLLHVYFARLGATPFTDWIWTFRAFLNAFTMIVLAFVTVSMILISTLAPDAFVNVLMNNPDVDISAARQDVFDTRLAGILGLLYTATPFFLASMHSHESLVNMISWFPRYYAFQPTILADFFAYSIARFDDLSWGTKSATSTVRAGGSGEAERAAARVSSRRAAREDASLSPSRSAASRSRRSELVAAVRAMSARESSSAAASMLSILQVTLAILVAVVNYAIKVHCACGDGVHRQERAAEFIPTSPPLENSRSHSVPLFSRRRTLRSGFYHHGAKCCLLRQVCVLRAELFGRAPLPHVLRPYLLGRHVRRRRPHCFRRVDDLLQCVRRWNLVSRRPRRLCRLRGRELPPDARDVVVKVAINVCAIF